jgi:hypothetical protein
MVIYTMTSTLDRVYKSGMMDPCLSGCSLSGTRTDRARQRGNEGMHVYAPQPPGQPRATPPGPHEGPEVTITVAGKQFEMHGGHRTVAEIKSVAGVSLAFQARAGHRFVQVRELQSRTSVE